jgi:hypothetical protein
MMRVPKLAGTKLLPTSPSMGFFPEDDRPKYEADHSPHLMPRSVHRSKARGHATLLYFHLVQFSLDYSSSNRLELNYILLYLLQWMLQLDGAVQLAAWGAAPFRHRLSP